ncbi:hypothetical protein F5141DRAFT_1150184 [Pisolithus sp. B1]|nr:hypothetical protein F5141DRAFT_1150184 [Pisolithus sp. B1]
MLSLVLTSILLVVNLPLLSSGLSDRTTGRTGGRPPVRQGAECVTLLIVSPFEGQRVRTNLVYFNFSWRLP